MLEFLAKRQQKRLGEENEAFAGAAVHLQRKSRRRRLIVAFSKHERVRERRKPLEVQSDRGERREGRLQRSSQRARERLEERGFDRRAWLAGLDPAIGGGAGGNRFAKIEETIRSSMRSSSAMSSRASGSTLA